MQIKIPYALKMKFLSMEGLQSEVETVHVNMPGGVVSDSLPGAILHTVTLDLSDDPESLEACKEWYRIIQTYFKTSYNAYKLDLGPYERLMPVNILENGVVHFHIDCVDFDKKDWRDWFSKEDLIYAPK